MSRNHHSHSMNETLHEIEFFHQQIEKPNLIWFKYKEEFIISQDINWLQMWMNQRTRLMSEACLFPSHGSARLCVGSFLKNSLPMGWTIAGLHPSRLTSPEWVLPFSNNFQKISRNNAIKRLRRSGVDLRQNRVI